MSDDADDVCGSEDTTTGEPCQFSPGESCPWHDPEREPPANGRDSKLSKTREEQIAQAIERGKSINSAARMAGVTPTTVYNWIDRGRDESETIYADFFERIERARGHGEDEYVSTIMQIAREQGDTATLLSMLKQRYPDEWGDVDRGEQAGGTVPFDLPDAVIEEWQSHGISVE